LSFDLRKRFACTHRWSYRCYESRFPLAWRRLPGLPLDPCNIIAAFTFDFRERWFAIANSKTTEKASRAREGFQIVKMISKFCRIRVLALLYYEDDAITQKHNEEMPECIDGKINEIKYP